MKIIEGFEAARSLLSRPAPSTAYPVSTAMRKKLYEMFAVDEPEAVVKKIIDDVRNHGDVALLDYTSRIDRVKLTSLEITQKQISSAYRQVDGELVSAIKLAAERIRAYHSAQKDAIWSGLTKAGLGLTRPLQRVGLYVPGGTASYPSTVLMTAIPAKVAGVGEIILVTPPKSTELVHPLTLVACDIAQVDRVFAVGGAQAIAAMAFGTESVPGVDKICGPGNIFVVLAKKLVYGVVDIDGLQGPSEVVIVADETANPEYCAADLLAQAEHDPLSSAILVTNSKQLVEAVKLEVEQQLGDLPRQNITGESLAERGIIAIVASVDEAIELANLYAPEHLCLMVKKAESYLDRLANAGCIVIGTKPTVVLGDYVAGPSHVLPTGGTARFGSPLNILDFIKLTSVITVDDANLRALGPAAMSMARAEGLEAHARAVAKRLKTG